MVCLRETCSPSERHLHRARSLQSSLRSVLPLLVTVLLSRSSWFVLRISLFDRWAPSSVSNTSEAIHRLCFWEHPAGSISPVGRFQPSPAFAITSPSEDDHAREKYIGQKIRIDLLDLKPWIWTEFLLIRLRIM